MFLTISIVGIVGMIVLMGAVRMSGGGCAGAACGRRRGLARLAYCTTAASTLALAVSGFGAPAIEGTARMSGLALLGHMVFAGVFIAGLTGVALTWAETSRFGTGDGAALKKVFFWCVLALGLVATLTVLVSMTPLTGERGQEAIYEIHRWSALGVVMALIGHGLSRG